MKIRQKIAMLLAAAMAFTAMPMVTMAAADYKVTNGVSVGEKDKTLAAQNLTQRLVIDVKDAQTTGMFFVNLTNAKWTTSAGVVGGTLQGGRTFATWNVSKTNDKELAVTFDEVVKDDQIIINLGSVELTGGDATVAVDGNNTTLNKMDPVVFAKTSDAKANVSVGDAKTLYVEQSAIADIIIEESVRGSLGNKEIKVELQTDDYEFVALTDSVLKFQKGFAGKVGVGTSVAQVGSDKQAISFKLTTSASLLAPGKLVIEGLQVKATTKTPATGDLKVKVSGDEINDAVVKVADIKAYGVTLKMKDEKVVEMVAGTKKDITFEVKENVKDCLIGGREIEVKLEKGFFGKKTTTSATDIAGKIKEEKMGNIIVNEVSDKDDWITGFTIKLGSVDATEISSFKFEDLAVYMPLGVTGDVKITMSGRAIGEDLNVVAVNVKAPVTVEATPVTLKVGLKDQVGGKIVIKETDKGMLQRGQWVEITLDKDSAIKIEDKGTLTVLAGDIKTEDFEIKDTTDKNIIRFKVKRASSEAATIEIKDMKFTPNRTVPQGTYVAKINGAAVAPDCDKDSIEIKDFVIIGTPNTEDITANGLKKGEASFVIGSNKYVVNGVEFDMDGQVYLANGRTMVPVRYVANALGVDGKDIYFANGTVTVIAASKTITLVVGDKVAKIGGAPVRVMTAAPVVKDGRTYVPVSEIGALLGVEATWDAAAQTATFVNK